jgi:hypothetical protein
VPRPLAAVESEIKEWIDQSNGDCRERFVESDRIWVIKFIAPRFLTGFLKTRKFKISATPGFTWGDGVYVTPLANPYSTMMYGRAGIMGWAPWSNGMRAYDATQRRGIDLYQEWIRYIRGLYQLLTTSIHANLANRLLRNAFRRVFTIDLVYFRPDQFNRRYVNPFRDSWMTLSDWQNLGPQAPGQRPLDSDKVRDCEWVAMVEEEFQESTWKVHYTELFGPVLHGPGPGGLNPGLEADLMKAYRDTRRSGATTPTVVRVSA